jgi:hypothetical protein
MNDEDFKQTIIDYISMVTIERYSKTMAAIDDVRKNTEQIKAMLADLGAAQKAVLSDLQQTGAAGHSAIMDGIVADQEAVKETITGLKSELVSAAKAVELPAPKPS